VGIGFAAEFIDFEVFPPGDTRHKLDAKKIGQPEDREALGVGISINRVGFDV